MKNLHPIMRDILAAYLSPVAKPVCAHCSGTNLTERYVHNPYGHDCGQRITHCNDCGVEWEVPNQWGCK